MKKKIHFHSDCPFFAGQENMLVNFFNSIEIKEYFDLSFSYRFSPLYEEGLKKRVPAQNLPTLFPMRLWDYPQFSQKIKIKFPKLLSYFILFFLNFLGIKFWFILRNFFVKLKTLSPLKNPGIDIVHINNGGLPGAYSCYSMALVGKFLKIPNILFVVNNQAVPYNRISRYMEWPLDFILKKIVTLFITGSKSSALRLKNVLHLPYEKIHSIPNGINPREIENHREIFLEIQNIQLKKEQLIFGMVALFEKRKGHHILIQAIKILKEKNIDKTLPLFILEGSGPALEKIKKFVSENSLNENILFLPHQKNIFDFINALDILLLPSVENEDFPNIILEAMSLGKPVISTIMAGIPEQVSHGETGLLCEPGNPYELADAIEILIKNSNLRSQMGSQGKQKFEENFKNNISVAKYRKLYLDLTKEK